MVSPYIFEACSWTAKARILSVEPDARGTVRREEDDWKTRQELLVGGRGGGGTRTLGDGNAATCRNETRIRVGQPQIPLPPPPSHLSP